MRVDRVMHFTDEISVVEMSTFLPKLTFIIPDHFRVTTEETDIGTLVTMTQDISDKGEEEATG